jgi:hypothetical protein
MRQVRPVLVRSGGLLTSIVDGLAQHHKVTSAQQTLRDSSRFMLWFREAHEVCQNIKYLVTSSTQAQRIFGFVNAAIVYFILCLDL